MLEPDEIVGHSMTEFRCWSLRERARIDASLREHGALLFRGLVGLDGPEAFVGMVSGFSPDLRRYIEGQSQRQILANGVYDSTHYPADQRITLHNELSYTADPPSRLYFACQAAAATGGETPILDVRKFWRDLPRPLAAAFAERGIRYVKNMHGSQGFGKSWQRHYETDDRAVVETHLLRSGAGFEWTGSDGLRIWRTRPAIDRHPETDEALWFNQASLWHVSNLGPTGARLRDMIGEENLPTHAFFEDGSAIPEDLLAEIRARMWQSATFVPWQVGDLLMLDNRSVAHGRNHYTGERLLYVAMA